MGSILIVKGGRPKTTSVVFFVRYYKYGTKFHLADMPPLCLLHGVDDELVPCNQSVMLDQELTRLGMPHEFYCYESLQHYFSTSADDATTQQMFHDSLDCLRRGLGAN